MHSVFFPEANFSRSYQEIGPQIKDDFNQYVLYLRIFNLFKICGKCGKARKQTHINFFCMPAPLKLKKIHHIAVICSNYERSKKFYTEVLDMEIVKETFRAARQSYKLDLKVNDVYQVELFSFPDPPPRPSRPEACGLRHLAFEVDDITAAIETLTAKGIATETVRIDELTGKRFTFFADPDGLPLELYEN
jgi:glyoxylase I family protein